MDYNGIDLKLVNVKTFVGHDTQTGLNADVVYNGVKILHVYDSAHGGCFEYRNLGKDEAQRKEFAKLEKELNERLKALPKTEGGWPHDLDWAVDEVLTHQENEKFFKKNAKKGLMIKEGSKEYIVGWKGADLNKMMKSPSGKAAIQKTVIEYQLKKGVEILNLEYIESLGIKI